MSIPLSKNPEYLKEIVLRMQGNLVRVSDFLGVSKQHIHTLVKRYQLAEWAREVRIANGHPATGNPLRKRPRENSKPL